MSKIAFDELAGFDPRLPGHPARGQDKVFTHFPCSEGSFQITVQDDANAPAFTTGDSVIIDPELEPKPGDMALVVVKAQPLFRRWRPRGDEVELAPLNPDWDTVTVRISKQARLLGVMSEHSRQRR